MGVRGEITQDFVKKLGFNDIEVIGCPSMFLYGDQLSITKKTPTLERDARIGVNITARVTPMGPIVTYNMERYPNLEYIAQDKDALRLLLWGVRRQDASRTRARSRSICRTRCCATTGRSSSWIRGRGWTTCARRTSSSGRGSTATSRRCSPARRGMSSPTTAGRSSWPATSRSHIGEMEDIPLDIDAAELFAEADYGPTMAGHAARYRTFIDYVERHGLKHVFQPGEDPAAFDARVAAVHFPPPVGRRRFPAFHRAVRTRQAAASTGRSAARARAIGGRAPPDRSDRPPRVVSRRRPATV